MAVENFLRIDDEPISLNEAVEYLRAGGDLQQFLMRILRQYIIQQELKKQVELEVDLSDIEQAIVNFRLQNQLVNPERFDKWLQSQGTNYTAFRNQITAGLKVEQLKQELTAAKVEELFAKDQQLFDQVVLSRIFVSDVHKAEQLKTEITEEGTSFESLVQEHSTANDKMFNGMMGVLTMGQLPETVRAVLEAAERGDIVGPVEYQGGYNLLRLEQRIPAVLEGQLKQNLHNQMFEQWWQQELKGKTVNLNIQ